MILLQNIRVGLSEKEDAVRQKWARTLGLNETDIRRFRCVRKSLDARDKNDIFFIGKYLIDLRDDHKKWRQNPHASFIASWDESLLPEGHISGESPVIVGAGPAGLLAALAFAKMGLKPRVIERGKRIEARDADLALFSATGRLNPESNVQFGEGGAGAYSDGKLTTGTGSTLIPVLLRELVAHGAPESILVDAKPHIGTDQLKNVVRNLRDHIVRLGGTFSFETKMMKLNLAENRVRGLSVSGPDGTFRDMMCTHVLLAIGHSARDTFSALYGQGVMMARKPFSMGVRIEHPQHAIDRAQYGAMAGHPSLPPADYHLAVHLPDGRGVYTFCMCPGGEVVAAASENGGSLTNGMSYHARAGYYANSALLADVRPEDLPGEDPLAGFLFQRHYEQLTFQHAHGYGPVIQTLGDFLEGVPTTALSRPSTSTQRPMPGTVEACLPPFVISALKQALPLLDQRLHGFADPGAWLYAAETRSSCPVRLVRQKDRQAEGIQGLYPCGEGSGYAGGIVTSAIDGILAAQSAMADILKSS